MTPVPRPETKRVFSSARITVHEFGAAVHLVTRGHHVEHVQVSSYNDKPAFWFSEDAKTDLIAFQEARELVNALVQRARTSKREIERKHARENEA